MIRVFDHLLTSAGVNSVEASFPTISELAGKCLLRKEKGSYMLFPSHRAGLDYIQSCPESDRLFHEIIPNGPQKLKFDLDGKPEDIAKLPGGGDIAEKYRSAFARIAGAIISAFYHEWGIESVPLLICASKPKDGSSVSKYSNHLVVPGYFVSDYRQAAAFTSRVLDLLSPGDRELLDAKVNKPNQSFRCVLCHKESDPTRVKVPLDNQAELLDFFVTNTESCAPLAAMDVTVQETHEEKAVTNTPKLLEICKSAGLLTAFSYRNYTRGVLNFDRRAPSHCEICLRRHVDDNSLYVHVGEYPGKTVLRMGCRSFEKVPSNKSVPFAERTIIIGEIPNDIPAEGNKMRRIDRMMANALAAPDQESNYFPRDHPLCASAEWNIYDTEKMASFELYETLIVQAAMKMGKTKALREFIEAYYPRSSADDPLHEASICVVSFRQTFTGSVASSFPDFAVYSDTVGIITRKRVIVQFESLHRLAIYEGMPAFDLLVCDESESIIDQMSSGLSKQFSTCLERFMWLVRYSRQVICMDANITTRTLSVLQHMRPERSIDPCTGQSGPTASLGPALRAGSLIHWNTHKNATADKWYYYTHVGAWAYALRHLLGEGKRVAIPTSSLTEGRGLEESIRADFPRLRVYLYSSETTPGVKKQHFSDVDKYWSQYDVLIYTPTVSAGVSFEAKHYDAVFAYFTDMSCPAETQIQMIGRIRDVGDKTYHIFVSAQGANLPETVQDVREYLLRSRNSLADTAEYTGAIIEYGEDTRARIAYTSPYFYAWAENRVAKNRTKNDLCRALVEIVRKSGAQQVAMDSDIFEDLFGIPMLVDDTINMLIYSAEEKQSSARTAARIARAEEISTSEDIDELAAARIQECILAQTDLTRGEMRQYDKYKLRGIYNFTAPMDADFVLDYDVIPVKRAYKNLCRLEGFPSMGAAVENIRELEQSAYRRIASYSSDYEYVDLHRRYVYVIHSSALQILARVGWTSLRDATHRHQDDILAGVAEDPGKFWEAISAGCLGLDIYVPAKATTVDPGQLIKKIVAAANRVLHGAYMVKIKPLRNTAGFFHLTWPEKHFSRDPREAEAKRIPLVESAPIHVELL